MRTTVLLVVIAMLSSAMLSSAPLAAAADAGDYWPQFRGPGGNGHSDATGLPLRWSETENVRWKTALHDRGWSSPVIWGDQIWMTTALASGHQMFALCVDRNTGKIVHDIKLFDIEKPGFCPHLNSYASPTPAIEQARVYLHFGSYGTVCLDSKTGETLWSRRDLPCDHWRCPGSSPILHGDLLFVTFEGFDTQYVVALDKKTGKTVWKKDRGYDYRDNSNGDIKKAFSTPQVVRFGGRELLISPSAAATSAYDPRTGEELWRVRHGGMNAAARPLFGHGMVYVATGGGGWQLFAVRPDGNGDVTDSHVAWKFNRGVPSRASQLLVDDLIYMVSNGGVATCVEAKTGQSVWKDRLGEDYCASPLYVGGRIYFFSQQGTATVIKPGRKFKVLAVNKLDEGCMASPAVVGKSLFLRTKTHLYRIEQPAK